ncbi:MAG: aroH [Bacilli bacterium]|nr:aroH [Bacilli bacterium]
MIRGFRGATTIDGNTPEAIEESTVELFGEIVKRNGLAADEVSYIIVTVTHDIDAAFPAKYIRQLEGWQWVPVMCAVEIDVQGALPLCIRLMISAETDKRQTEVEHVFLRNAVQLRPDLLKNVLD